MFYRIVCVIFCVCSDSNTYILNYVLVSLELTCADQYMLQIILCLAVHITVQYGVIVKIQRNLCNRMEISVKYC